MTRWTLYDEIKDDCDALDRVKREVLALADTDLSEAQLAHLMRIALEIRTLRTRAQGRKERAEPRRQSPAERQDAAKRRLEEEDTAQDARMAQFL